MPAKYHILYEVGEQVAEGKCEIQLVLLVELYVCFQAGLLLSFSRQERLLFAVLRLLVRTRQHFIDN